MRIILRICALLFQSTLPGWGATASKKSCSEQGANFNPRSPDGERLYYTYVDKWFHVFQSTLPGWGATTDSMMGSPLLKDFNPRSPDGERRVPLTYASCICQFQSTLPGWGATGLPPTVDERWLISIHAPRMGSDIPLLAWRPPSPRFQSTLPGWGATATTWTSAFAAKFQSTLPGWGATP